MYPRIEFDQSVKSKLRLTLEDMRKKLFESQRDDGMYNNNRWMVVFSPNSVVNMVLRRRDTANEENLYNNLFFEVY